MNLFDMVPVEKKPRAIDAPSPCCATVIARYEAIGEIAAVAKERGNVALCCDKCQKRIQFQDGVWNVVL